MEPLLAARYLAVPLGILGTVVPWHLKDLVKQNPAQYSE